MNDYRPISCQEYAELELAIMHGELLRVYWRDPEHHHHLAGLLPLDLRTRDHAEYLLAEDDGGKHIEIRLDRIRRFQSLGKQKGPMAPLR